MSGGLVPSKSTVYVSNLPFSLTNNDLHKIFEFYGKVVKVTIVKDRKTRQSKGIAFVLFLTRESAQVAVRAVNNRQMFGRTLKCSIAVDNGRASEFIRRVYYADKRRCYECGDSGHLSYQCPKNILGDREPPKKKRKRKRKLESQNDEEAYEDDEEDEQEGEDPALESLSAAIKFQQQKIEEEEYRQKVASGTYQDDVPAGTHNSQLIKKRIRQDQYFSDEEVEDDPND